MAREAATLAYPLISQINGDVGNVLFPAQPVFQQAASRATAGGLVNADVRRDQLFDPVLLV